MHALQVTRYRLRFASPAARFASTRPSFRCNKAERGFFIHLIHTNTRSPAKRNETMRQGRSHAPKLPSALLGAPTATTVSTRHE